MFGLRNKKIYFQLHTLIFRLCVPKPSIIYIVCANIRGKLMTLTSLLIDNKSDALKFNQLICVFFMSKILQEIRILRFFHRKSSSNY